MNGNPLINETLLQMKYARVISLLAKKLAVPEDKAMAIFIIQRPTAISTT